MVEIYLLLGTNLGEKSYNLHKVKSLLKDVGLLITAASTVYKTAAWGKTDQPVFLNQVIRANTTLSPRSLLSAIHAIEQQMGRVRFEKWGERLIDIDILYYGKQIITEEGLIIPHPEISKRRFTLVPLAELQPDFIHPQLGKSHKDLLKDCPDVLEVKRFYVE